MFLVRKKYTGETVQVYAVSSTEDAEEHVKTWFLFFRQNRWGWEDADGYEPIRAQ